MSQSDFNINTSEHYGKFPLAGAQIYTHTHTPAERGRGRGRNKNRKGE